MADESFDFHPFFVALLSFLCYICTSILNYSKFSFCITLNKFSLFTGRMKVAALIRFFIYFLIFADVVFIVRRLLGFSGGWKFRLSPFFVSICMIIPLFFVFLWYEIVEYGSIVIFIYIDIDWFISYARSCEKEKEKLLITEL